MDNYNLSVTEANFSMTDVKRLLGDELFDELQPMLVELNFDEMPASIGFHGPYQGALLDHSLLVGRELVRYTNALGLKWTRPESPAVIGILHDICKAYKFRKTSTGFELRDDLRLDGHGSLSCALAQLWHVKLTNEEVKNS